MESQEPRRRGRPPIDRGPQSAAEAAPETTSAPTKRRRRASVGGHRLKLQAPARDGYVRRWVNDDGNRIAEAQELAYDHVTDSGIQTSSADSRISRLVGTKANGEPLRAFLMETPATEYAAGCSDKEAIARQVDEAIAAGRDSTGQMSSIPESETYGRGSIQRDR
jgi:hypothetical protein